MAYDDVEMSSGEHEAVLAAGRTFLDFSSDPVAQKR